MALCVRDLGFDSHPPRLTTSHFGGSGDTKCEVVNLGRLESNHHAHHAGQT